MFDRESNLIFVSRIKISLKMKQWHFQINWNIKFRKRKGDFKMSTLKISVRGKQVPKYEF